MALDPELARLFNQTAYVAPFLSVTTSGDRVYGDAAPVRVRQEASVQLADTSPNGEQLMSSYRWFTLSVVSMQDHVWLVGQDPTNDALARMPKQISTIADEDGSVSHFEVLI